MIYLKFVLAVILAILVWCALVGGVAFLKDLHRFKSELEFSGSRKQLIEYLMSEDRKEKTDNVSES